MKIVNRKMVPAGIVVEQNISVYVNNFLEDVYKNELTFEKSRHISHLQ